MSKRKKLTNEEKLISALKKIPCPLIDKRHNLEIYFDDNRARSNQSRFEHIVLSRHQLKQKDIERIPIHIKKCIFKKDQERTDTYNIYIKRNNYSGEYIKISVEIKQSEPNVAVVKTVFITNVLK